MFIIMQYLLFIVLFLESWLLANTSPLPLGRLTDQLSGVYSMGLVNKRSGENLPETNKIVAPKFMMDLYSLIAFDNGDKKKGVLTNGNKIRCFLAGKIHAFYIVTVFDRCGISEVLIDTDFLSF